MSPVHTYIVKEGAHWKAAPAGSVDEKGSPLRMKCYRKGDTIRLTREAAESLGDHYLTWVPDVSAPSSVSASVVAPPASQPPAPAPEATPEPAQEALDLSDTPWQTVKARVAEMESADEVQAVLDAEEAGKKPRQSILEACRVRLEELAG